MNGQGQGQPLQAPSLQQQIDELVPPIQQRQPIEQEQAAPEPEEEWQEEDQADYPTPPLPDARAWAQQTMKSPNEAKLAQLEPGEKLGTSRVPFQLADRKSYLEMTKAIGSIANLTHVGPIALVNLHDLWAIQTTVNDERLVQHLDNPYLVEPGKRAQGHGGLIDRPVVVRKDGLLYIHDGHHRLTAATLRGQKTAKVRLVDLDGQFIKTSS